MNPEDRNIRHVGPLTVTDDLWMKWKHDVCGCSGKTQDQATLEEIAKSHICYVNPTRNHD